MDEHGNPIYRPIEGVIFTDAPFEGIDLSANQPRLSVREGTVFVDEIRREDLGFIDPDEATGIQLDSLADDVVTYLSVYKDFPEKTPSEPEFFDYFLEGAFYLQPSAPFRCQWEIWKQTK